MGIQAVNLDTLPTRTRAMSEDNQQLAADIAAVLATGAGASDGVDYASRDEAAKIGDHARRVFLRSKPTIPDGKVVRARYDATDDVWHWTIYFTDAAPKKAASK